MCNIDTKRSHIKLSIIVPVFNAALFIEDCVKSIINQTYSNIEIVLVDDGSSDNSLYLCQQLSKTDSRIKVYHTKNGGVSKARNFGLSVATGSYVGFVDSDDTIVNIMYEKMIAEAEIGSFDMVQCGYNRIKINTTTEKKDMFDKELFRNKCCVEKYLFDPNKVITNSVCTKIFKRSIIDTLKFDETIRIGEDFKFVLQFCSKAENVKMIPFALYNYFEREKSTMHSLFSDKNFDDFIINDWCRSFYSHNAELSELINVRDIICCMRMYISSTRDYDPNPYSKKILSRFTSLKKSTYLGLKREVMYIIMKHFPFAFAKIIRIL